jgi:hypothetical protein
MIKIEVDRLNLFLSRLDSIGSAHGIYYGSARLSSARLSGSTLLLDSAQL